MDMIGVVFAVGLMVFVMAAAQPSIKIHEPDDDDCQRVVVSRFLESVVMVDAVICEGESFDFDGQNFGISDDE